MSHIKRMLNAFSRLVVLLGAALLLPGIAYSQQCQQYRWAFESAPWEPNRQAACDDYAAFFGQTAQQRGFLTYVMTPINDVLTRSDITSFYGVLYGSDATGYQCVVAAHYSLSPDVSFGNTAVGFNQKPCELQIALIGASATKALIAGPVLAQTALVTQNGSPAAGISVNIILSGGTAISGVTDANGLVPFTYVPPRSKGTDHLVATCVGCGNTAAKDISIAPCDVCEGRMGNPVSAATGEKEQDESDWQDSSPHGLSWSRHYRSYGNRLNSGLGSTWSHPYSASIFGAGNDRTVQLGSGASTVFARTDASSPWRSDTIKDRLTDTPDGGAVFTRGADDASWKFDAAGRLTSITQRNGWVMSLGYNAANQLVNVTNAFGRTLGLTYNGLGLIASVSTPDAKVIGYAYDGQGNLTAVSYPDGSTRGYLYENGAWPQALTGITDETGAWFATFGYDASGRAVSTQHAGGAQGFSLSYDQSTVSTVGSLVSGSNVNPALFQSSAQVTDPLGVPQTWTFQGGSGSVRLLGASGAYEGAVANRSFNQVTLPTSETDFLGYQTSYQWDASRALLLGSTKATGQPEAQTVGTQWHPTWRLPVLISEAGRSTAYVYDAAGNKLSQTVTDTGSGAVRTGQWSYNLQGLVASYTDAKGAVSSFTYDSVGNMLTAVNPLGQTTAFVSDNAGRMLQQVDPNGLVHAYGYDLRGRLLSENHGGEVSSYTYTPAGLLASATQPDGYAVTYQYDAAQRLIGATDNRGSAISYTLDAMGNRVSEQVRDSNGNIALSTQRSINALNRVAAQTGAQGQTTAFGYDANGEPIRQTDPLNQSTAQTLDGIRRPTATTYADNAQATQSWNGLNQLTGVTDPKGVATGYSRNAFGEVVTEASPDIGSLSYQRDAAGQVSAVTDAKGQTSQITRDALGRVTQITYDASTYANFSYDAGANGVGYLSNITDQSGSTAYTRDALGRVLTKTQTVNDNPANPSVYVTSYGYTGGVLSQIRYPSGMTVFYRRTAGRITGIDVQEPFTNPKKPSPVQSFVTNLAYTGLGASKSWNWMNGDSATRTFDADGRMTGNEFASYSYDAASRIIALSQSFFAQAVSTVTVGTGTSTVTSLYTTSISWVVSYDSRNRITDFSRASDSTEFRYDANGNRTGMTEVAISDIDLDGSFDTDDLIVTTAQGLNIDPASNKLLGYGQVISKTRNGKPKAGSTTSVVYSLDANGALTSDGSRVFQYDGSRRLSKVTISSGGEGADVVYLNNALGQRVFKSEPQIAQLTPDEATLGTPFVNWLKANFGWLFAAAQANATLGTTYVYDEQGTLLGEYGNGGTKSAGRIEYIWLPTEDGQMMPIGLYRASNFYAVHADHINTPRLITDATKKPVWQWPYSAFGNNKPTGILKATANPNVAITNQPVMLKATAPAFAMNQRYPGQYFDEESNLNYNYFRNYQGAMGRYTQPDPIGLGGGLNRFGYVDGNPLSFFDLLGLAPGDKDFGIKDPGFWKWWERNKGSYGPFDSSHEGFNPRKPFDLPNRQMAKTMQEEYEQCMSRDSGRGGKTRGKPNINELLRGSGRGGGRSGSEE